MDFHVCIHRKPNLKKEVRSPRISLLTVFSPVNDGYVEKDASSVHGAHWSLIAVDRVHLVAHYVDSYFIHNPNYRKVANIISTGLGSILGEEYIFSPEYFTPDQWEHNTFAGSGMLQFCSHTPLSECNLLIFYRLGSMRSICGHHD